MFECSTRGGFGFCISKGNEKLHTRNLLTSNQRRKISKDQSNQGNNASSCKCVETFRHKVSQFFVTFFTFPDLIR